MSSTKSQRVACTVLALELGDDLRQLVFLDLAEDFVADGEDRRQSAAADAAHRVDREQAVGSHFARLDAQDAAALVQDVLAALQLAGRAQAYRDAVLAGRGG